MSVVRIRRIALDEAAFRAEAFTGVGVGELPVVRKHSGEGESVARKTAGDFPDDAGIGPV